LENILLQNKYFERVIILFWILCLISINTIPENFTSFFKIKSQLNLLIFFNFLRFIFPSIILIILLLFVIFSKKKFELIIIYFFFYGLWQLIIQIAINRNIVEIGNYQLIFNLFSTLFVIHIGYYFGSSTLLKKIMYTNLFFIGFILAYYVPNLTFEFINTKDIYNVYGTKVLAADGQTFLQPNPRITGIGRMMLIIFYFSFFFQKKIKKKIIYYLIYIFLFLQVVLMYFFQSRIAVIGILLFTFYYIIYDNTKIKKKLFVYFIIIILPIISSKIIQQLKVNIAQEKDQYFKYDLFEKDRFLTTSTSGRVTLWKIAFDEIKKNNSIFGNGPQYDRKLISKTKIKNQDFDGNNISNALIYSYLCGGIISFFFLILIYYKILKLLIYIHINCKKLLKDNPIIGFTFLTLILLVIRSIFENGFAIFGIDLIFTLSCYFILKKKVESQK
jgi:hypothetical protein